MFEITSITANGHESVETALLGPEPTEKLIRDGDAIELKWKGKPAFMFLTGLNTPVNNRKASDILNKHAKFEAPHYYAIKGDVKIVQVKEVM